MKKLFKTLSAMLVTAVAMTALVVPVSAETQYTAIPGNKVTFYKTLIVDKDAKIPNLEFAFKTTAGVAVASPAAGQLPILAGTGTIADATVTFAPGSTVDAKNAHSVAADYKTVTLPVQVDLTKASYDEPGIYRYYITEQNGNTKVVYDVDNTPAATTGNRVRTLDVYVEDTGAATPTLAVTGYVMYLGKVTGAPSIGTDPTNGTAIDSSTEVTITGDGIYVETTRTGTGNTGAATKTNYIMNLYKTHDLTFGKEVIGNQGSRDKYFKVTVKSENLNIYDKFPVDMTHAVKEPTANSATTYDAADMKNANDITELTGAQLNTGYDFYLQDGNYVTIVGLPEGCHYEVSEDAEDYTSNERITAANSSLDWNSSVAGADALGDDLTGTMDTDKHTGFTNEKKGLIPTGVLLVATPVIIVALIAIAGVVFFAVRSAKSKAQEDEAETAEE